MALLFTNVTNSIRFQTLLKFAIDETYKDGKWLHLSN